MGKPVRRTRLVRALELREPALNIIRKHGKWADYGETRLLEALHAGFRIAYRTPFNKYDVPAAFKVKLAILGLKPPQFLPYGLEIWAKERCMCLEWDDEGKTEMWFRSGPWEAELARLGATAA
jgi:hypothetical protein